MRPLSRIPLFLLFFPVLLGWGPELLGSPRPGDEVLAALQTRLERKERVDDLVHALEDLRPAELRALENDLNRAWPRQLDRYLLSFDQAAEDSFSGSARADNNREVRRLREEFLRVRDLGEGAMKKPLQETSWPALKVLRTLLMPSAQDVLARAPEALRDQRERLLLLARFRNELLEFRLSSIPAYGAEDLARAEAAVMEKLSRLDRAGLRILKKNEAVAEREALPKPEVAGLRELNEMRLLVGLEALEIDPKLCQASRDHSRDMQEHGFFSHTSPLEGKETPAQRAARAGTSGAGENIFMGSPSPAAANRGWFFSPGHHKNMFREGFRRAGLGNHGRHWTQMFGR